MKFHQPRLATWLFLAVASIATIWARPVAGQNELPSLESPVAMTMHPGTGHVFIVEQGKNRLLRWNGTKVDVLHAGLSDEPVRLTETVGATFRNGNRISLAGRHKTDEGETLRIATFKVDVEELASFDAPMSVDLELAGADSITAIASTDFAIYLATQGKACKLWRIPAGKASFGKPQELRAIDEGTISALTVSSQGHLVAAFQVAQEATRLRFIHAETGQPLLDLMTDVMDVTALRYDGGSGRLYAVANKSDRHGVFRLDAAQRRGRQSVRGFEVSAIDRLTDFTIFEDGGIGIVDDEAGQAIEIELR